MLFSTETGAVSSLPSKRCGLARGFNNHLSEARPIPVYLYISMSYSFVCCLMLLYLATSCVLCVIYNFLFVVCTMSLPVCCVLCHFLFVVCTMSLPACCVYYVTSCVLCILCHFIYVVLQWSSTPLCVDLLIYINNTFVCSCRCNIYPHIPAAYECVNAHDCDMYIRIWHICT